jgi:hypothetical protein
LNYDFNVELKKHFFLIQAVKKAKTDLKIPEYFTEINEATSEMIRATVCQFSANQGKRLKVESRFCGVVPADCKEQSKINVPENRIKGSNLILKIMIDFN